MPTDQYSGPFGTYTSLLEPFKVTMRGALHTNLLNLKALIPDPAAGVAASHPDFDMIPPATAKLLRDEISSLITAAISNTQTTTA